MNCPIAVRAILSKLPNFSDVAVDFAAKKAIVTMKEGTLTEDQVQSAFKDSRYKESSFKKMDNRQRVFIAGVSGMT